MYDAFPYHFTNYMCCYTTQKASKTTVSLLVLNVITDLSYRKL